MTGVKLSRFTTISGPIHAYNFPRWKHTIVRQCFPGQKIIFFRSAENIPHSGTILLWGMASVPAVLGANVNVLRLEDGFLRSVGLGADLVRPLSWVVDGQGIYYNTSVKSDLETILTDCTFDQDLLTRAAHLRQAIVKSKITKYNTGAKHWTRPFQDKKIILVPGQVESDASIRYGAPDINTNIDLLRAVRENNAGAYVIFKPHPDVTAGLRLEGKEEANAFDWCDEIIRNVSMDNLLDQVDEVHVLTSLAGFEALLRNKPVTCWGKPFYAGWGLTTDKIEDARKTRLLTLDELTAGTLFQYPLYLSRNGKKLISPEEALAQLIAWRNAKGNKEPFWQEIYRVFLRIFAGVR